MKKSIVLSAVLVAASFASAAEYAFNTQTDCRLEGGKRLEFKDGCHVLKGACHFMTDKAFTNNPAKKYKLFADIKCGTDQKTNGLTFAVMYLDEKGRTVQTREYLTVPNSFTELAKPMKPTDKVITLKKPANFKKGYNWPVVVAFEAKADESDIPNPKVTTKTSKVVIGADTITVTLDKPTFAAYPAGTKVRLHYALAFYRPLNIDKFYNHPTDKWVTIGGDVPMPKGVKKFKPVIVYYDWAKGTTKTVLVRNFKLIEE